MEEKMDKFGDIIAPLADQFRAQIQAIMDKCEGQSVEAAEHGAQHGLLSAVHSNRGQQRAPIVLSSASLSSPDPSAWSPGGQLC
ncbi:hypothetical protein CRUP_004657 [Coryphaenoides rupestris]|nr:hypothetical protein CRUP_004657 [Coryphaenoides rupestris]